MSAPEANFHGPDTATVTGVPGGPWHVGAEGDRWHVRDSSGNRWEQWPGGPPWTFPSCAAAVRALGVEVAQ